MKVLLTCDPEIPVPPILYGGIERILEILIHDYLALGVEVTLCAHPSSQVPCKLVGWTGSKSQDRFSTIKNSLQLTSLILRSRFDIIHSFSRLGYMMPIMPFGIQKIMSYQREPSLKQITRAVSLSKKDSMVFTGCSNYISDKIKSVGEAYTIYNGVSIQKYTATLKVFDDAPLVFLGRIEEIKGTHIAIEVAKITNKRLIIAGNIPPEKQEYYREKIQPHLNDRITYVGPVNDKEKNEILGSSLAFLMPIQWNEPFGIVMAEALACGTPVIGFGYGSVPEVVQDGVNGFVCQNIEDMIGAVEKVHVLDRMMSRSIAEQRFSNTKISGDYLSLYKNLLNRK